MLDANLSQLCVYTLEAEGMRGGGGRGEGQVEVMVEGKDMWMSWWGGQVEEVKGEVRWRRTGGGGEGRGQVEEDR